MCSVIKSVPLYWNKVFRSNSMFKRICLSILLSSCFYLSTESYANQAGAGKITFPTSLSKEAQSLFIDGVLFLHNFDYGNARAAFQQAEKQDSSSIMPYWGEAMTHNHPLWGEVDVKAGRDVLSKLGKTPHEQLTKAHDEKEKGLIKSVQVLFGEGEKATRDNAYLRVMSDLAKRYPDDQEIAMFYALALLGSTEGERNDTIYMRAGAIAEEVARLNAEHPGALHYAIHSFDDPVHAPLGLFYARQYSKIACNAPHALHMPSHIYLALGMWPDVIASNQQAWEAGLKNNNTREASKYNVHDLHALQWLSYGELQARHYDSALQHVKTMEQIVEKSPSPMAKWYYSLMRAAYIMESDNINADLKSIDMTGVELNAIANNIYVDSVIRLNQMNNKIDLTPVLVNLEQLCKAIPQKKFTHCGETDYFTSVTEGGITTGKIVLLELKALIELKNKETAKAIQLLKEASAMEEKTAFGYGPPTPVKPASELLADVYFANKDYLKAYEAYKKSLFRAPNRTLSQRGIEKTIAAMKASNIKLPNDQEVPYVNPYMQSQ